MILVSGMKKNQPELFDLNGKIENGQNVRVFPISNWTELTFGV
jgi:sulfate adenylyltransferase subunit 2